MSIGLGVTMGKLTLHGLVQATFNTIIFSGSILFLILAAYIFSTALSFAGLGEQSHQVHRRAEADQARVLSGSVCPIYRARRPDRRSRHDRHYRAAALSGARELRHRSDTVRRDPGYLCRAQQEISPPIGINLFVIQSIWDGKLAEVVIGTIPFHLIMFVVLAMVIAWPELRCGCPPRCRDEVSA